jgi:hypothetical protein
MTAANTSAEANKNHFVEKTGLCDQKYNATYRRALFDRAAMRTIP